MVGLGRDCLVSTAACGDIEPLMSPSVVDILNCNLSEFFLHFCNLSVELEILDMTLLHLPFIGGVTCINYASYMQLRTGHAQFINKKICGVLTLN